MSYAIIGIVFLLLIVFVVLAAKTWHWVNIVFLILTFLAGTAAIAGLSQVMAMRHAQMTDFERSVVSRETAEAAAKVAIFGPIDSVEYDRNSLRGINEMLTREMAGRGRVWAGGEVTANGDNRVFKFAASRSLNGDQGNEMQDMVLYAFADGTVLDTLAAKSFIGTVRVISETADQVELEPIFVADPPEFTEPKTTWSLFEKMPGDSRDIFRKAEGMVKDEDFNVDEYRNILTSKYFPVADYVKTDPAQDQAAYDAEIKAYNYLVDRYAFDGMSLGEIKQWLAANNRPQDDFEPDVQEEFVQFRFDKRSDPFTVDAATGNLDTDGPFTKRGLAVDPALFKGEEVTFEKDDTVLVDRRTADGYQLPDGTPVDAFSDKYPVQEIGRFYIRQLKDFPYELADLERQTDRFVVETQHIKDNIVVTETAVANAEGQVAVRDELTTKLEQDNQNLKTDLKIISDLHDQRAEELRQDVERARVLSLEIRQRYAEIMRSVEAAKNREKIASK